MYFRSIQDELKQLFDSLINFMYRFPECLHCFCSRHDICDFVNLPTQSLYDVCPLYYPCSAAGTPEPKGSASGSDQDSIGDYVIPF